MEAISAACADTALALARASRSAAILSRAADTSASGAIDKLLATGREARPPPSSPPAAVASNLMLHLRFDISATLMSSGTSAKSGML